MITYLLRDSPFPWTGSKSNWHRLPEGHTCQLSPSASRWASELMDSTIYWRNWNPITVTRSKSNSPFFQGWKDKMPNAAGCIFLLIKYIICQNHFSLNTLMEILGSLYTNDLHINSVLSCSILSPNSLQHSSSVILLLWIMKLGYFPRKRVALFHWEVPCDSPWMAWLKLVRRD